MPSPTVQVKTLGCKVNTFDSQALANQFAARGYVVLEAKGEGGEDAVRADVTVVNTCSVTANADREGRYLARRIRKENPDGIIVFTGCYAQTDSAALVAMEEIDVVVPNEAKTELVTIVDAGLRRRAAATDRGRDPILPGKLPEGVKSVTGNRQAHFKAAHVLFDRVDSERTRAFVKIQDGCNGFCSYCLIPYARGASKSVPEGTALAEIRRLVDTGVGEIVLTGIHIGDYGRDLEDGAEASEDEHAEDEASLAPSPFVRFVEAALQIQGLKRLRISSLEPRELTPSLVELLYAHKERICDHLHLPLQSGSDSVLKRMRRTYDSARYARAVELFHRRFPEGSVSADVIPGFPGETEEDFQATVALVRRLELSSLHVFPYSSRPNTSAARLPGHLPGDVVKERARILREISTELSAAYARRFLGRTVSVLWEDARDGSGRLLGHAMNYLPVCCAGASSGTESDAPTAGSITDAVVKGFVEQGKLLVRPLTSPAQTLSHQNIFSVPPGTNSPVSASHP